MRKIDPSRASVARSNSAIVVSLTTLIDNAVETVSAEAAQKQIEIKIDAAEEVIFLNADPLRLEQVVWNLLNNAVKFTPAHGRVFVRLERLDDAVRVNTKNYDYYYLCPELRRKRMIPVLTRIRARSVAGALYVSSAVHWMPSGPRSLTT